MLKFQQVTRRTNKARTIICVMASHGKDLPVGYLNPLITGSACRCKLKHVEKVMHMRRPNDIVVNQRVLSLSLSLSFPSHITERHTPTDCLCCLILPWGKPEHHSSEAGEYQDGYIHEGWKSSATAALLPRVYLKQLSLLLL